MSKHRSKKSDKSNTRFHRTCTFFPGQRVICLETDEAGTVKSLVSKGFYATAITVELEDGRLYTTYPENLDGCAPELPWDQAKGKRQ